MTDSQRQGMAIHEAQGECLDSVEYERAQILRKYSKLVNDVGFDKVELGLKEANIFAILGMQRMEIRHSNFLAWMFDPSGNHGMGNIFLQRFLRDISLESPVNGQSSFAITDTSPKTAEIRREWNHIDILIILDRHVVCIENKVGGSDHANQLLTYKNVINEHFPEPDHAAVFVYLTPDGRPPNDRDQREHYISYSYANIADHADRVLDLHGRSLPSNIKTYIEDYTLNIRRNLMQQDHLNALAQQLYANHKEVLDFIFDNKPDIINQAKAYFAKELIDKGYVEGSKSKYFVRFLTKDLDHLFPRIGDGRGGWSNGEIFSFELQFSIGSNNRLLLNFQVVIHPSMPDEIRGMLAALVDEPDSVLYNHRFRRRRPDASFAILIRKGFTLLSDVAEGVSGNAMASFLGREWPSIIAIVDSVSESILGREAEIKSILEHREN